MGDGMVGAIVEGVGDVVEALEGMQARVDIATQAALKKVQAQAKTSIKSRMRGQARWNHRGQSKRFPDRPAITVRSSPEHISRGGGPGKMSGELQRSIRSSRKSRQVGRGTFNAVVMSGGLGGYQNIYKKWVEGKFPYFKPGIAAATPKMPRIWNEAWAKATSTD